MWEKLECPNCHKPTIPFWRKQLLGPAIAMTCPECGGKVGVPMSSLLAILPFVVAFVAAQYLNSTVASYALLIAGFLVMACLFHFYIPLIKK
jgi:hypothetical protein